MTVKADCRHYIMQSTGGGEKKERCAVGASTVLPFACPEGCIFYEPRKVSPAGWHVDRQSRQPSGSRDPSEQQQQQQRRSTRPDN